MTLFLISNVAYTQTTLIKSYSEIKSTQLSPIRLPVNGPNIIGTGKCKTEIVGYETSETLLLVKIKYQLDSHNCYFTDLRFILNGKSYKLDGLSDKDFERKNGKTYSWKYEFWKKEPETWIWFYVGERLAQDALEKASASFGIFEYLCGDQSCLTDPRIDIIKSNIFLDIEARRALDEAQKPMREAEKRIAKAESEFNALLRSRSPRAMYLSAVSLEDSGDRSKAKTVYRKLIDRFPNAQETLLASQRLTR